MGLNDVRSITNLLNYSKICLFYTNHGHFNLLSAPSEHLPPPPPKVMGAEIGLSRHSVYVRHVYGDEQATTRTGSDTSSQ